MLLQRLQCQFLCMLQLAVQLITEAIALGPIGPSSVTVSPDTHIFCVTVKFYDFNQY